MRPPLIRAARRWAITWLIDATRLPGWANRGLRRFLSWSRRWA